MNAREIKSFFYSQYFSDGLRMSTGILLPSLISAYFNHFALGLTMSLGALCICTIDSPGPLPHKRNAMAAGNLFLLMVAVTTGFARLNVITLGLEVTLFSFLFSMFTVYGNRAASVGASALLVMIFMMDKDAKAGQVLIVSATILAGGIWYLLFSLVFFGIRPYRAAQQTLGENIGGIADFLRIKAGFYLPEIDIDDNYRKLVSQQIKVSLQQDAVRELLFKSRLIVKESTNAGRALTLTFIDLVDMFEQIMATHYDYGYIRQKFKATGILNEIAALMMEMAGELDNIAFMVLSDTRNKSKPDFDTALEQLKSKIDGTRANAEGASNLALKKILINLRDLNYKIKNISNYYNSRSSGALPDSSIKNDDYPKFVLHQDYAPHIFIDNLSFGSAAFKHALRVSLVCLTGFIIAKNFAVGHQSYWVLLTIIVILKPGFSLSKQRNYQRLIGTLCGGVIGVAVLLFIPGKDAQFAFFVVFMIGAYSFLRLDYVVSVIFMTPYVLILFKLLGAGFVVKERIVDTVIGSSIAFIASYLVFPSWEFEQIQQGLAGVINANVNYLVKIAEGVTGKNAGAVEYKLARKDVFVKSANLSAAFERMASEPKSKQKKIKEVHKFVVLNHILSSYIATIASGITAKALPNATAANIKLIKRSIAVLNDAGRKLDDNSTDFSAGKTLPANTGEHTAPAADDVLLNEQLGFIHKISTDIARVTDNILS